MDNAAELIILININGILFVLLFMRTRSQSYFQKKPNFFQIDIIASHTGRVSEPARFGLAPAQEIFKKASSGSGSNSASKDLLKTTPAPILSFFL